MKNVVLFLMAAVLMAGGAAQAALVDNFESYTGLPITADSTDAWTGVVLPARSTIIVEPGVVNQVVQIEGVSLLSGDRVGVRRSLGDNAIPDNSTKTLFMRFNTLSTGTNQDFAWGLSANDSAGGSFTIGAQVAVYQGNFVAKHGTVTYTIGALDLNEWYNMWLVFDNTTNKSKIYLNQGTANATGDDLCIGHLTGQPDVTEFNHRGTLAAGDALDQFAAYGVLIGYEMFDDMHMMDGESLVNPIPEPMTLVLLGLGGLGMLYRRR